MALAHLEINGLEFNADDARARMSANPGPIERHFFANKGRLVHKWVHFLAVYDRYLAPFKDSAPTMLEIGVSLGGSLEMWRSFFGPAATIFGIDINPQCLGWVDPPNQVRIGSQADPAFLTAVADEAGPLDIVLDDGSHVASHQLASFRALWPRLKPGGIYMIEDLHTAYWPGEMEGGFRRPGTAIEVAKLLIDDQHAWYHDQPELFVRKEEIGAIHMYDSIVVIEKVADHRPGHFRTGG